MLASQQNFALKPAYNIHPA